MLNCQAESFQHRQRTVFIGLVDDHQKLFTTIAEQKVGMAEGGAHNIREVD